MSVAGVLGTGSALPEKVITNADLEKLVETSDQWITDRTGIRERRQAAPHETTSTLSVQASRHALEKAGIKATDLDLIICSTISPDMPLPSTASLIQRELGAHGCCAFDLAAACSGFLFGMTVAEQFIRTGACQVRAGDRGRTAFALPRLQGPRHLRHLRRRRGGGSVRAGRAALGNPGA